MNPLFWILGGGAVLMLLVASRKKTAAQPPPGVVDPYLDPTKITRPVDERFFHERDQIYKASTSPKMLTEKLAELRAWYVQYLRKKGQKGFVVDRWIREYERIRRTEPEKHAKAVALRHQRYILTKKAVA
jgi:hypothetical protein